MAPASSQTDSGIAPTNEVQRNDIEQDIATASRILNHHHQPDTQASSIDEILEKLRNGYDSFLQNLDHEHHLEAGPSSSSSSSPTHSHSEENENDNPCTICLDQIEELCIAKPCQHTFDFSCLLNWLERSSSCPQCRTNIAELEHGFGTDGSFQTSSVVSKAYSTPYEDVRNDSPPTFTLIGDFGSDDESDFVSDVDSDGDFEDTVSDPSEVAPGTSTSPPVFGPHPASRLNVFEADGDDEDAEEHWARNYLRRLYGNAHDHSYSWASWADPLPRETSQ